MDEEVLYGRYYCNVNMFMVIMYIWMVSVLSYRPPKKKVLHRLCSSAES